MPNEWNKVLQGLFQGGTALSQGILQGQTQSKLQELYNSGLDRLGQLINPQKYLESTETPYEYDANGMPLPKKVESQLQEKQYPVDMNKAMQELYSTTGQMIPYGETANPYIQNLESFYKSNIPKEPKLSTHFDYNSGTVITTDEMGNIVGTQQYKQPREKEKKNTVADYSNLSFEDALNLTEKELEQAFNYLNPEVQAKLREKYPSFIEEVKTPSGYRRRGGYRGSTKKTEDTGNIIDEFNQVKADIENAGGWNKVDLQTQSRYHELRKKVEKEYPGVNPDEVAVQEFEKKDPVRNITQWVKDIARSWNKQPQDIPTEEWAREILEEQWTDEEWQMIQEEFARLTGQDINKFMQ